MGRPGQVLVPRMGLPQQVLEKPGAAETLGNQGARLEVPGDKPQDRIQIAIAFQFDVIEMAGAGQRADPVDLPRGGQVEGPGRDRSGPPFHREKAVPVLEIMEFPGVEVEMGPDGPFPHAVLLGLDDFQGFPAKAVKCPGGYLWASSGSKKYMKGEGVHGGAGMTPL